MDKRVQGLVALAAVVVIAVGGYLGYAEWQRSQERLQLARNLRAVELRDQISDIEDQLSRWDAGERKWAYDKWGSRAPGVIDSSRFILDVYKAELSDVSTWKP